MKNINLGPVYQRRLTMHQDTLTSMDHLFASSYTITITCKPAVFTHAKSGMGRNARQQFKIADNEIKKRFLGPTNKLSYTAELTSNGNIHFHGLCTFKHEFSRELLIDDLKNSKVIGYVVITKPNNEQHFEKFKEYLFKDYVKTLSIVNKNTKHEDDILDIMYHGRDSFNYGDQNRPIPNLRGWLVESRSDSDSPPLSPLDDFIIQSYTN